METYQKIKELVILMESDINKIFNKNQSKAARRVRHQLQDIRKLSKQLREEVQIHLRNEGNI